MWMRKSIYRWNMRAGLKVYVLEKKVRWFTW